MDAEKVLDLMLSDMESASDYYRPTQFWKSGLGTIVVDLKELGFENFRSHPSAHFFYVPLYSHSRYRKHKRVLDAMLSGLDRVTSKAQLGSFARDFLSGKADAERDFCIFMASKMNSPPHLNEIGESDIGKPIEHFSFRGKMYSRSFLNYLRGL